MPALKCLYLRSSINKLQSVPLETRDGLFFRLNRVFSVPSLKRWRFNEIGTSKTDPFLPFRMFTIFTLGFSQTNLNQTSKIALSPISNLYLKNNNNTFSKCFVTNFTIVKLSFLHELQQNVAQIGVTTWVHLNLNLECALKHFWHNMSSQSLHLKVLICYCHNLCKFVDQRDQDKC